MQHVCAHIPPFWYHWYQKLVFFHFLINVAAYWSLSIFMSTKRSFLMEDVLFVFHSSLHKLFKCEVGWTAPVKRLRLLDCRSTHGIRELEEQTATGEQEGNRCIMRDPLAFTKQHRMAESFVDGNLRLVDRRHLYIYDDSSANSRTAWSVSVLGMMVSAGRRVCSHFLLGKIACISYPSYVMHLLFPSVCLRSHLHVRMLPLESACLSSISLSHCCDSTSNFFSLCGEEEAAIVFFLATDREVSLATMWLCQRRLKRGDLEWGEKKKHMLSRTRSAASSWWMSRVDEEMDASFCRFLNHWGESSCPMLAVFITPVVSTTFFKAFPAALRLHLCTLCKACSYGLSLPAVPVTTCLFILSALFDEFSPV